MTKEKIDLRLDCIVPEGYLRTMELGWFRNHLNAFDFEVVLAQKCIEHSDHWHIDNPKVIWVVVPNYVL